MATKKKARKSKSRARAKPKWGQRQAPAPTGDVIEKVFKGKTIRVTHDADGYHYDGKVWKSLTAIALRVTGYRAVSGPAFFGSTKRTQKGGA